MKHTFMTWGTRGRAQHSIEAVLGTFLGEPVLPCLMDFQGFWWTWSEELKTHVKHNCPDFVRISTFQSSPKSLPRWRREMGGEKRGDGGDPSLWVLQAIVRPRSTGLALWVFSHIAGDNKSQHDRAFQDFLTPPLQFQKRNLLTCFLI